jgi:hypothetical protein
VPGDEAGQRTNLREETHLVHLKEQQQCQVNKPTTVKSPNFVTAHYFVTAAENFCEALIGF